MKYKYGHAVRITNEFHENPSGKIYEYMGLHEGLEVYEVVLDNVPKSLVLNENEITTL